ncbi:hypothetical protein [Aureimonas phyllosphaerae]|uniref:Uncharacterized protein n=1 Tax=Aureimonas phyllosphaerae TaxID=1166078 RepID=A0A7W6BY70_9HYPH|nr:hypothetical protein [Aureimonas phyllosphaerae]MBB3938259.1 hypothetical protein [Aureimonas phyllosphaerae]MBB3962266.1 hypothetical protein [Aureimonas phyllosphaerae]SFF59023.1 hypothetical protein SAMN05216566_1404 [Aureimonas phyllosphaerae]
MERIEIDLDWAGSGEPRTGKAGGTVESSIRYDALEQAMLKLVAKPQGRAERDDLYNRRPLALDVMAHRRHDTILVSARRGDGKTTFLTDILRLLQQGREEYRKVLPQGMGEDKIAILYPLGIVDPTLIETKQNIVVMVVEKIEVAVKRAYRLDESAMRGAYEDFKRVLRELATGLPLLDGIGDSELFDKDWADADYVLDRGLDKARSAGAFERAFHRFVETACSFLGADAFVLAIDDVDTSFDRGWPVLEALRKYFATPRLKVIMAGDLRLCNLVVRQQQWKQISSKFFDIEQKVEGARSYVDQIVNMVDLLQDQYLVKIVRPENRVTLRPLLHYADYPGISFKASQSDPGVTVRETIFMQRYARRLLGIRAGKDRALIRSTLLRLPLRSGLQVVSGAWELCHDAKSTGLTDDTRAQALAALSHVASAGLMTFDLAEYDLQDPNPGRVLAALSQWLTAKGLWLTISRFHPSGVNEMSDLVSIRIAAQLIELFRANAYATIDYCLRICLIREKLDRGEITPTRAQQFEGRTNDTGRFDLHALLEHLNAGATERATQFVSRLAAWDAGRGRQVDRAIRLSGAVVPGVSRLREASAVAFDLYGIRGDIFKRDVFQSVVETGDKSDQNRLLAALPPPLRGYHQALIDAGWSYSSRRGLEAGFIATFANTLDSLRAGLDPDARAVAMIPAMRLVSGQGAENGVYSVLRLIAAVAELIGIERTGGPDDKLSDLRDLITMLAASRSYPTPGVLSEAGQVGDADEMEGPQDNINGVGDEELDDVSSLPSMLGHWLEALHLESQPTEVAPVTLARAWTRFTYAFEDIVARLVHTRTRYLGVLMHRAIVAFLHAIGVEVLRAAGRAPGAKAIDNPIESSLPFLQILKALDEVESEKNDPNVRFFRIIFSCPLWGYFLARSENDITGKADRGNATAEIFSRYTNFMSNQIGLVPRYEANFSRNGQVATFDGLYFLLNSVQLQGLPSTKKSIAGAGIELNEALIALGVEPALRSPPAGAAGGAPARDRSKPPRNTSGSAT